MLKLSTVAIPVRYLHSLEVRAYLCSGDDCHSNFLTSEYLTEASFTVAICRNPQRLISQLFIC